ncbi:MAG: hypothetical protein K5894_01580 [Lachnospiraceae bacterium]|nr:hypothetical protein [Lachnospiraceae bacterium]
MSVILVVSILLKNEYYGYFYGKLVIFDMNMAFMKRFLTLVLCLVFLFFPAEDLYAEDEDLRQYAHGVSYIENPQKGLGYIIWSDAYKKGIAKDGSWTHDVYSAKIKLKNPKIRKVRRIVRADEAQEPASAAATDDGNIMVTFEDGNDAGDYELAQRFVILNSKLKKIKKYPQTIALGGHSGHAASTRDHHLVFWSEGWVQGGGVDGLGSGDDLYLTSMDSDGENMHTIEVSKSEKYRDWWPLAAASDTKALLVWQRYVDGEDYAEIKFDIYDPASGKLKSRSENSRENDLSDIRARYYCYNVVYLEKSRLFALNISCEDGGGVILLIDEEGKVKKRISGCGSFVREAAPAVIEKDKTELYYPVGNDQVECVSLDSDYNAAHSFYSTGFNWSYCGMAGFVDSNGKVWFAALDTDHFRKGKKSLKLIGIVHDA